MKPIGRAFAQLASPQLLLPDTSFLETDKFTGEGLRWCGFSDPCDRLAVRKGIDVGLPALRHDLCIFLAPGVLRPVVCKFLGRVARLASSRRPTGKEGFGDCFLMIRAHQSSMFQKP